MVDKTDKAIKKFCMNYRTIGVTSLFALKEDLDRELLMIYQLPIGARFGPRAIREASTNLAKIHLRVLK